MFHALVATLLLALAPSGAPAVADASRGYFAALLRDRKAITSGTIELVVTRKVDTRHPTLQGSARTYRIWFDLERYRFDLDEVRPALPSESLHARVSYADGTYRIIDRDRPDVMVREYSTGYLKGEAPPNAPSLAFDPRLLGLCCMEFALLRHSSTDKLASAFESAEKRLVVDPAGGQEAHVLIYDTGLRYAYITKPNETFPRMIDQLKLDAPLDLSDLATRMSPRVTNTLAKVPGPDGRAFDYPSLVEYRKPDLKMDLELLETVEVTKAEFNRPIDSEVFGWQALRPRVGAWLSRDGKSSDNLRWDGSDFVRFKKADYGTPGQFADRAGRRMFLRIAAVGAIGLAILIALISLSYKRAKP